MTLTQRVSNTERLCIIRKSLSDRSYKTFFMDCFPFICSFEMAAQYVRMVKELGFSYE